MYPKTFVSYALHHRYLVKALLVIIGHSIIIAALIPAMTYVHSSINKRTWLHKRISDTYIRIRTSLKARRILIFEFYSAGSTGWSKTIGSNCNLEMHLHRSEAHRIALILIITCGISWASTQCKTIVMDVHMKKCRLGARAKRGLEKFDLQKYDEKYESKRQEQAGERSYQKIFINMNFIYLLIKYTKIIFIKINMKHRLFSHLFKFQKFPVSLKYLSLW